MWTFIGTLCPVDYNNRQNSTPSRVFATCWDTFTSFLQPNRLANELIAISLMQASRFYVVRQHPLKYTPLINSLSRLPHSHIESEVAITWQ